MLDSISIDPRSASRLIASSMQALERRFEVVADNLANLETVGHKQGTIWFRWFLPSETPAPLTTEVRNTAP